MPRILESFRRSTSAGVLALATVGSALTFTAPASAQPALDCPDVQLVFARGSGELPGLGIVGDPFSTALTAALPALLDCLLFATPPPIRLYFPRR